MNVRKIAIMCHDVNKSYCAAIGDNTQVKWSKRPDWQKESAVKGVEFHLANPDANDSASHDSWMEQKLADGWKYGEVKDAESKEHPCIVPFEELPLEQQIKDKLFRQTVHALAPLLA